MTLVAAINIACNSYGLFSSKELFTCATYVDRGNLDNYMGINGAKVASEIKDLSLIHIYFGLIFGIIIFGIYGSGYNAGAFVYGQF